MVVSCPPIPSESPNPGRRCAAQLSAPRLATVCSRTFVRTSMLCADLELSLRRAGDTYMAEIQFIPAGSSAPIRLIAGDLPSIQLDEAALQELREAALDMRLYGERLTGLLFADQRLAAAFGRAVAVAQGADAPLRLRLRLDE